MEVAARPEPRALTGVLARVDARILLGLLVAVSAVARTAVGWLRVTPNYYPDEYIYSELGRSISATGAALVRGSSSHFPALLMPIVTSPVWLVHDVATAYRLLQAVDSLAMSLAAIPVWLVARRVGLGRWSALAAAALALAVPDLLYAGMTISEPFAYPLALAAFAAGVAALDRPSLRLQALFVALAGLTAFARVQFVLLPAAYLVAAAVVGLRERRPLRMLREQALPFALLGAALLVFVAMGLRGGFGYYPSFVHLKGGVHALRMVGSNLLILLFSGGWVLAPGAVIGLGLVLWKARSRAELAFVALLLPLAAGLLVQASYYGDTNVVQERYLFYVVPLGAIVFGLYAARGWPLRLVHGGLGAAQAAVAATYPLAGYAVPGMNTHSPFLYAVDRVVLWLGEMGRGTMVVAGVATAMTAVLVLVVSLRPRAGAAVGFSLALVASVAASALASSYDTLSAERARGVFLPPDRSWVDHAHLGRVALLSAPGGLKTDMLDQLFWNRSLDRVLVLPEGTHPDAFAADSVSSSRDGSLSAAGRPVTGPLLADEFSTTVRFRNARVVARSRTMTLVQPRGVAQLSILWPGRFFDGFLAPGGSVIVWPDRAGARLAGWLTFRAAGPAADGANDLHLHVIGGRETVVHLPRGRDVAVRLAVCASGRPWQVAFSARPLGFADIRMIAARATEPVFTPDPAACSGASA